MQAFVCRENIARYRKLLDTALDAGRHALVTRLLAEEEAKLAEIESAGKPAHAVAADRR